MQSMANKVEKLNHLREELGSNNKLPLSKTANLVFGEGDANAKLLFIGEAPGFHEDKLGRPFVGRAGQLLNKLLEQNKITRESVYITNIVKRRPPENRDPLPEEIEAYKPYLEKQIEIIGPKVIATLGRFSMNYFMPEAKISQCHGKVFKLEGRLLLPLYHPAAALRSTGVLKDLEADFRKIPHILKL